MNFARNIIKWYGENKRHLPWRETSDPYKIWVSEVILQQTRVDQGYSYYRKFLDRFPDVRTLADSPESEVMKVWQGLGYYSRARHLHQAAGEIVRNHTEFPSAYDDLIRLKGIGDYSASAIASIAFNQPYPVVDGNVLRVMARYEGITAPVNTSPVRNHIREVLSEWIDRSQPGIFNQAIMELGALICIPRRPRCGECPVSGQCYAFGKALTSSLPVKVKARSREILHYNYLVFLMKQRDKWFTWLNKRTGKGIWKGLFDFPLIETDREIGADALSSLPGFLEITQGSRISGDAPVLIKDRHILSHRELKMTFFLFRVYGHRHPGHLRISWDRLNNYPVPRPIEKFLKKLVSDRVYF